MKTSKISNIKLLILVGSFFVISNLNAQQKPTEFYNFNYQKFNEYPTFLFISIDSIFNKESKLRTAFKRFIQPFVDEFKREKDIDRFHYNLYLSLGLYETDTKNHIANVNKIKVLYKYLIKRATTYKRIANSLTFQEDFTHIDRYEFFENPPHINCITFDFRRLAKDHPKLGIK
jgi:hypothetical protein